MLALIDFGNTLAEETFMRRDSESFPTWRTTWLRTMTNARLDWDSGRLSTDGLADVIAAELGCTAEAVRGYMSQLCRRVDFYPTINAAVRGRRARGGPQALVTVNPDLFQEVVTHYSLLESFDAVITSSSHGTDDKVELCWRALELLGVDDPSDTVLIDNLQVNIDGWVTAGGKGYLFVDDDTFADDVACGKVPGFETETSEGIKAKPIDESTDVCDRSPSHPPGEWWRAAPLTTTVLGDAETGPMARRSS